MTSNTQIHKNKAKPFLKWAGGKKQLLGAISKRLPQKYKENGVLENYVEPFVGGGALFFFLKNNFHVKKAVLYDVNRELVLAYNLIKEHHKELIDDLKKMEKEYLSKNNKERKKYFYSIREKYNEQRYGFDYKTYNSGWISRTSYLIFLNKTCFNGLYRVNQKGEFNVPHGSYKNPKICDEENLLNVNKALQNTKIKCSDFVNSKNEIKRDAFVYLDPPYRPLNGTANFTSYSRDGFDESDQRRLAKFFKNMDKKGALLMLSNSDPKNENPEDEFFDKIYEGFRIERVTAKRAISCVGSKRGEIKELIIRNYPKES